MTDSQESPSSPCLSFLVSDERWQPFFQEIEEKGEAFLKTVRQVLALEASQQFDIVVTLAGNEVSQELNHAYRGKNKPTNVLSFPQPLLKRGEETLLCGDIVMSYDVIEEEAAAQKKPFFDHVAHLFVHGVLHLLGHDHEKEEEALKMESLEIEILKAHHIPSPYEV